MSATPARDALVELAQDGHHSDGLVYADTFVDAALANPDLVLAALIESGWTPSDDQLRAMGGDEDFYITEYHPDGIWAWRFPTEERNDG